MEKIHWWGPASAQIQRVNAAADELQALRDKDADVDQKLQRLFELDRHQGHEIARLQGVVMALTELLIDAGLLQEERFAARLKAVLEDLEE